MSEAQEKRAQLEAILRAAKKDPYEQSAKLERQVWYRNARFRSWGAFLPIDGRWSAVENGLALKLACTACQKESSRHSDLTSLLLVKSPEKVFDFAEKKALHFLEAFHRCDHLAPLHGPDPQEVLDILSLELLA